MVVSGIIVLKVVLRRFYKPNPIMKKFFALAIAFMSMTSFSYAQKCTGSPGTVILSVVRNSPSSVMLSSRHSGATGTGWDGYRDQFSYKISGALVYTNCPANLTGLISGMRYDFRVSGTRLCLKDGAGSQRQTVGDFVNGFQLNPVTPTAAAATNIRTDAFTASWNPNGGVADHFLVDVSLDQAFNNIVFANLDAGSNTSLVIGGLIPGTFYYYRVRATNTVGTSGYSISPIFDTPVSPPRVLSATNIGATSFTANWQRFGEVTHFYVSVFQIVTQTNVVPIYLNLDAGTNESLDVTGLAPSTYYIYYVKSTNGVSTSPSAGSPAFYTLASGALSAPTALVATNISTTSFKANWQTTGVVTHSYLDVSLSLDFSTLTTPTIDADTAHNATVSGLLSGLTYYFRVRAANSSVISPNSNPSPPVVLLPAAPVGLAATYYGTDGITARWQPAGVQDHFNLYFSTDSTDFSPQKLVFPNPLNVGTSTSANVRPFSPNVVYYFRVSAVNSFGISAFSNTSQRFFIGMDSLPPAIPTGFLYTLTSPVNGLTSQILTWQPNTEIDIIAYKIYEGAMPTLFATVGTTAFVRTVPSNTGLYLYSISAVDNAGNESPRSPLLTVPSVAPFASQSNTVMSEETKIFPNPTNGLLFLDLPNDKSSTIEVRDMAGMLIKKDHYQGSQITIDLNDVQKGTYLLNIKQGSSIETKRILVNK